jgi:hypothetical protein
MLNILVLPEQNNSIISASSFLRIINPIKLIMTNINLNFVFSYSTKLSYDEIKGYDYIVLNRYSMLQENISDNLKWLDILSRFKGKVIYDIDDHLFAIPKDHPDYNVLNPRSQFIKMYLERADFIFVSNTFLQNEIQSFLQFNSINSKITVRSPYLSDFKNIDLPFFSQKIFNPLHQLSILELYLDIFKLESVNSIVSRVNVPTLNLKIFGHLIGNFDNSQYHLSPMPVISDYHKFLFSFYLKSNAFTFLVPRDKNVFDYGHSDIKKFQIISSHSIFVENSMLDDDQLLLNLRNSLVGDNDKSSRIYVIELFKKMHNAYLLENEERKRIDFEIFQTILPS